VLTENGRIQLKRIRWTIQGEGSSTPIDVLLDEAEKSFTQGVREMLCRLNQSSSSFAKTAQNILRLASIEISGESVRQLVEYEGRIVSSQLTRGKH
jgi:ABC-type transport system involved in cytochrome bd biosynthesis fused ATPase/permease subunit